MPSDSRRATAETVAPSRSSLSPLLTEDDLSQILGRSVKSLRKDRLAGTGAPFVRVGRLVRYRPQDVGDWLATLQARRSTSEPTRAA
jgi:hypothetical protein